MRKTVYFVTPGVYEYAVKFSVPYVAQYCYALNGIFGNPPDCVNGATGIFVDAVETVWANGTVKLDSQPGSAWGAGWILEGQQRLYEDNMGRILIADGSRTDEFQSFPPLQVYNIRSMLGSIQV